MARTEGVLISQAEQTRYSTNAIKALGLREDNEIMRYAQKAPAGISAKDLRQVVFYQYLKDADSVVEVDKAKQSSMGAGWDATAGRFKAITAFNGSEILRGIHAFCQSLTSTYSVGEYEYAETMLNADSAILDYQKSDMNAKFENIFLSKLKALNAGTLTLNLAKGQTLANVTIPTKNVYGDKTVEFEKGTNLMEFRRMLANAKIMAGSGREVFMVGGIDLLVLIETATRFVNHDWANMSTKKGDLGNAQAILSASREILQTKYIILRDFDTVFPRGGSATPKDECSIFLVTQNAFGFDRSNPVAKVMHVEHHREILFDMVCHYAIEITDPIGFYRFDFKYGQPS